VLFAIRADDSRGQPNYSGEPARCPACHHPVRGKDGVINVPHWAHLARDCDPWSEPESEWHLQWKKRFPPNRVEVPIERDGEMHRADIVLEDGRVVELQHSPISVPEIMQREDFYKHMIWVFDVRNAFESKRLDIRHKYEIDTFRWKHPKKHIAYAEQLVYLDFGAGRLFRLGKMYPNSPCGGKGRVVQIDAEECFERSANT
jgi:competence protein CoiA